MRIKRELLLSPNRDTKSAIYHCVSRCVNRQFFFEEEEKEWFMHRMRRQARFSGVEILSFCLMSNHFHLLIKVPAKANEVLEPDEFLARIKAISNKTVIQRVELELERILVLEGEAYELRMQILQQPFLKRMHCLSSYMKELKLSFTQWFNKRKGMVGTQWEGRFKSLLVETGYAAQMTSAYIDLNPVRAGMVSDPKDYRWSSYGSAVAGEKWAQRGLMEVMKMKDVPDGEISNDHSEWGKLQRRRVTGATMVQSQNLTWSEVAAQYRMLIAEEGEVDDQNAELNLGENVQTRRKRSRGFRAKEVEEILAQQGELTLPQLLRCKVRYFTDGAVLGSREFVEEVFTQVKQSKVTFKRRETGARSLSCAPNSGLFSLRDLKTNLFG